jgi:PAS domain S-box-containing protein
VLKRQAAELTAAKEKLEAEAREHERAEEALQRFKFISDYAYDGQDLIDREGRIVYVNRRACERLGYSEAEMLRMRLSDIDPTFSAERLRELFERLEREHVPPFESLRRRKDGSIFPVEMSVARVSFDQEDLYLFAAVRDISERKEAEAALREAHEGLERRVQERTAALQQALEEVKQQVAERRRAEKELRALSARLRRLQDEERRRLARELHDTTGQNLAAVRMNLSALHRAVAGLDPKLETTLSESHQLIEECMREVRTLSYALHPPLLDEAGLASALRSYAEGYSQRSGIAVQVDVAEGVGRLPPELELATFRIVQECLTNVHRHSGSPRARIRIEERGAQLAVEVSDEGTRGPGRDPEGMRKAEQHGIGIRAMRERALELGGDLQIRSDPSGTVVRAVLPLEPRAS